MKNYIVVIENKYHFEILGDKETLTKFHGLYQDNLWPDWRNHISKNYTLDKEISIIDSESSEGFILLSKGKEQDIAIKDAISKIGVRIIYSK